MDTRIVLSAVLAASLVLVPALVPAQTPQVSTDQTPQAKIERLQAQVQALSAQVKKLQAQLRAKSPLGVISPFYKVPNIQIPNYEIAPFQFPNIQSPTPPNVQTFSVPPYNLPRQRPQPYWNIPPCTITLIGQQTR